MLDHCCCCESVTKLCPTLCNLMDCSTPGFLVLPYLLEFAQTHVQWVSDAIQSSHPLLPPSPPILSLGQDQGFFQWVACKIPWVEEPGRLQSLGSRRVRHDRATSLWLFTFMPWRRKWKPTPVLVPGESQGWGSLVGCHLGSHRVGHDWSDAAAAAAAALPVRWPKY